MKMEHDKLTLEDNFTLDKVINYVEEEWCELSYGFQLVIVKWLIVELFHAQKKIADLSSDLIY